MVPVRDEETDLPAALAAIERSRADLHRRLGAAVHTRVVVVLDSCTDGSAGIAASFPVDVLPVAAGRVGAARAAGARHAIADSRPDELWLANTDADSEVPREWLVDMHEHARRGVHVVLGMVRPGAGLAAAVEYDWHARHLLHEDHPHVHGANFGIRADAYLALGGWGDLATGEDRDLAARAASAAHLWTVRTSRSPVRTSTRLVGRAPLGFSSYLRGLGAVGT